MEGSWGTWKEPTQTQGELANPTKKGPRPGNRTRDLLSCEAAVFMSYKDWTLLSDVLVAVWLLTLSLQREYTLLQHSDETDNNDQD